MLPTAIVFFVKKKEAFLFCHLNFTGLLYSWVWCDPAIMSTLTLINYVPE